MRIVKEITPTQKYENLHMWEVCTFQAVFVPIVDVLEASYRKEVGLLQTCFRLFEDMSPEVIFTTF